MCEKITPIEDIENICFKCLEKKKIHKYSLYRSEYGSSFDNNYTYLQICDECEPQDMSMWFNEKPEMNDYCADYKYEKDIINFVNTLPLQGKELFWNRCAYGACSNIMDSQDWIDMHLGILPDEKYEEYGMYSPSEIKAYKERFPICEYPVTEIFNDGSKGCWCPFGASGNYNQQIGLNISDECYYCKYFKVRETPIKEIYSEDFNDYELYMKSKLKAEELKKKFEK